MRYETPEVFEIGPAEELTLGPMGCCIDSECERRMCDGGDVAIGVH